MTQVSWLRERLLKLGTHVVVSVRRIVLHLPTATPDLHAWRHIARALGLIIQPRATHAPRCVRWLLLAELSSRAVRPALPASASPTSPLLIHAALSPTGVSR